MSWCYGAPDRIKLRTPILLRSRYNFCGLGKGQTPALDQRVQGSRLIASQRHVPQHQINANQPEREPETAAAALSTSILTFDAASPSSARFN
jgi:hypothetical protein